MKDLYTPCPEKRGHGFFLHNFNKCRHSFAIFGVKTHFTKNTPLRSDDVIVTSLETTSSRTAVGKDATTFNLISLTLENYNALS